MNDNNDERWKPEIHLLLFVRSVLTVMVSYFIYFLFQFCLLFAQRSFSNSIFFRPVIIMKFHRSCFEVEADLLYIYIYIYIYNLVSLYASNDFNTTNFTNTQALKQS